MAVMVAAPNSNSLIDGIEGVIRRVMKVKIPLRIWT